MIAHKQIFQDRMAGYNLYGSLIWGDFDIKTSDIDVLCVLKSQIIFGELERLSAIHEAVIHENPKWKNRIEVHLKNHEARYNCTLIDLYDRSVIASITDTKITAEFAIRTLQKALNSQTNISKDLILHSDQGVQFTSKAFVNAPMERYFNTLKNECTN